MAYFNSETVQKWRGMAADCLARNNAITGKAYTVDTPMGGADAWNIAHLAGICSDAYRTSPDCNDSHIATALRAIFPNATFRGKESAQ